MVGIPCIRIVLLQINIITRVAIGTPKGEFGNRDPYIIIRSKTDFSTFTVWTTEISHIDGRILLVPHDKLTEIIATDEEPIATEMLATIPVCMLTS